MPVPRPLILLALPALAAALGGCGFTPASVTATSPAISDEIPLSRRERLGKSLFMDTALSEPAGTSCASCHDPAHGFSGNHGSTVGVPRGSQASVLGLRNTPSAMYASFSPAFAVVVDSEGATPTGGQFLDGRVDTQAEQAKLPLLSATEMNNPDHATVAAKVAAASYADDFRAEFGAGIFADADATFDAVAVALEAFERTAVFHPFSSRFDDYLRGDDTLDADERRGMSLFFDPEKGNCVGCHVADPRNPDPAASLFTDFTYDNLGVPRNLAIPANADPTFFDLGLGGPKRALPGGDPSFNGAFKVPTLRNVALKPAFMHNGYFSSLEDVVSFYVTRDTDPTRWYLSGTKFEDLPPADRANVNTSEVPYDRHLGEQPRLDPREVAQLVRFLRTLTERRLEGALPPASPIPAAHPAPPMPVARQ